MSRKLYVGNLPYETGEAELQELFSRAGTVETVKVMRDMATGRARGFAFVEMSTDEDAQRAITELNEYQLGGRGLTVNEARPKPASTGGGFGRGDFQPSPVRTALVVVKRLYPVGACSGADGIRHIPAFLSSEAVRPWPSPKPCLVRVHDGCCRFHSAACAP